jgi:hypothetical protein
VVAITVVVLCAVVFLYPAIAAPVNADDRYWYLWVGWRADGSVLEVFRWSWGRLDKVVEIGRLNTLTQLERRLVCLPVIELAVATSTPIVVYQALVKILLVVGSLLSGLALVRALRWRDAEGHLVQASRGTLYLAALGGTVAVAVGAQAQAETRNGWTAYPVNTYSAAMFIFGTVALLLWLTRLVVERSKTVVVVALVILVLLAIFTALSYELVFPAVPIAAAALAVVPVTDKSRRSAGRRAKFVTGLAYLGTFAVVFVAIRIYLASICAHKKCYEGVTLDLGKAAARTMVYNFISVFPGAGGNELLADMELVGWGDRYPVGPTIWSVLIGLAVAGALFVVWWARRPDLAVIASSAGDSPDDRESRDPSRRTEGVLLCVGAGLFLLVALGTAAVMGLSPRSHAEITEPGILYRNAMVTWSALAFCGVLTVLALGFLLPRPAGLVAWATLAAVIGTVGAMTLPGNLMALRANRVGYSVVEQINWEVVQGDIGPGSDARRCMLFEESRDAIKFGARRRLIENANLAFKYFHDRPFCSDPKYPGGPGWEPTWQVQ